MSSVITDWELLPPLSIVCRSQINRRWMKFTQKLVENKPGSSQKRHKFINSTVFFAFEFSGRLRCFMNSAAVKEVHNLSEVGGKSMAINGRNSTITHKAARQPKCLKSKLSTHWQSKQKWRTSPSPSTNDKFESALEAILIRKLIYAPLTVDRGNKALRKLNGTLLMPRNSAESHSHCSSFSDAVVVVVTRDEI